MQFYIISQIIIFLIFVLFYSVLYIVSNDENKANQLIIIHGPKQHQAISTWRKHGFRQNTSLQVSYGNTLVNVSRHNDLTYILWCLLLQVLPTATANNLAILSSLTFHATSVLEEFCNEVYLGQHSCHTLCSRATYPPRSHSTYTSTQSGLLGDTETHQQLHFSFFFFFFDSHGKNAWRSAIFGGYLFCMNVIIQIKGIWHRLSKNTLFCAVSSRNTYIFWGTMR